MLGQTSLAGENASLQVETDQAASSQDVASQRSTRFGTGLGFAVLMLIGVSACALYPLASNASGDPSHLVPSVAFNPLRGIRSARHTGSGDAHPTVLPAVLPGSLPASSPQALNWQPAASDVDSKNVVDLVAATTIAPGMARHSQVRMGRLRDEDGFYIDESDTSGMPHAVLKMKVLNELGVDPDAWYEFQEGNQPREKTPEWVAKQDYEGRCKYYADLNKDWEARRKHWLAENPTNQEFDRSMGIEMAAALRKELLLRGEHTPKKHLIVFDFDGTLTEDYAGVKRKRLFGSEQRIADMRDFLETLHEDAHLIVCSRSVQNLITDRLRDANLLHPFDLVVDRNHMRHLDNANKGRVLNELLLPLFPSIGGPGDVLFVDDDPSNIKDLKKLAPHCTTFECERNTGLTRADIRLLLGEQKEGTLLVDGVSTHRRGEQNGTPTSFLTTDGGEREPVAKGS